MTEEFSMFSKNEKDIGVSKKKRSIIIIIAVFTVIVIVAVVLVIIFPSSNKNKKQEDLNYIITKYNVTTVTGDSGKIKLYDIEQSFNYSSVISYLIIEGKHFTPSDKFQFNTVGIKEVIINFKKSLNNTSFFFNMCENLISVNLTNFNSTELSKIAGMFYNSTNLTSIIFGDNFSTKKVKDMRYLFDGCISLTSINLNMLDTSKAIDFSYMFKGCTSLKEVDINHFNTTAVLSMDKMFYNCKSLKYIDISNFKTNSLNQADYMFYGCSELTSIKINFIGETLYNLQSMFEDCNKLTSIDLSSLVGKKIMKINRMFNGCNNLQFIDFSNFNTTSRYVFNYNGTFENISTHGTLKYNSKKFNATYISGDYLSNWTLTDVKNSG